MKKIIALLLALTLVLTMVGCGGKKEYPAGTARDTGAFRKYTNSSGTPMNQLDLWFNSESEARRWGTKYNVTIWYK